MRIDRQRLAVGFERVLVVADILQDAAEARPRPEVARLERQHLTDVGERIIIVAGVPLGTPGATNFMRIAFVGGGASGEI